MAREGFDNQKYLTMQSQHIRDRIDQFGGKLWYNSQAATGREQER